VLAVRRENAVKPGEVDSWLGHQCRQPCDEIQRAPTAFPGMVVYQPNSLTQQIKRRPEGHRCGCRITYFLAGVAAVVG
jgi:hypothetical protein